MVSSIRESPNGPFHFSFPDYGRKKGASHPPIPHPIPPLPPHLPPQSHPPIPSPKLPPQARLQQAHARTPSFALAACAAPVAGAVVRRPAAGPLRRGCAACGPAAQPPAGAIPGRARESDAPGASAGPGLGAGGGGGLGGFLRLKVGLEGWKGNQRKPLFWCLGVTNF